MDNKSYMEKMIPVWMDLFKKEPKLCECELCKMEETIKAIVLRVLEYKDEQVKEPLIRFMHYLERRGFIADDIVYDTEHQVDTFLTQFNIDKGETSVFSTDCCHLQRNFIPHTLETFCLCLAGDIHNCGEACPEYEPKGKVGTYNGVTMENTKNIK